MSKWDWLHGGLELATYLSARDAKRNLDEMKTATEMKEARRVLLEAMRSWIFDISRDIQLAQEQLEEFPQQVYIVSRSLAWRLADSGLTPDLFPDFQDKEYVLGIEKRIASVSEEAKAKLTRQQIADSEQAVEYIAEMPLLEQAISAKGAKESLRATDERWEEVSAHQKKRKNLTWLGVIGLVLSACAGMPLACWGLEQITSGGFGNSVSGLLVLAVGAAIPAGTMAVFVLRGKSNPEYKTLKASREAWRDQLLPREDWQHIVSTFGDLSSEQFAEIREERLSFLDPLLGGDFRKYLASGETPSISA